MPCEITMALINDNTGDLQSGRRVHDRQDHNGRMKSQVKFQVRSKLGRPENPTVCMKTRPKMRRILDLTVIVT